ncbi:MAG: CPBP family intramembrane metalloprotease [Ruminococcaceae bacterium]|nr:CPBP family intramembrane metalloprotease [Oscillospiraceae bacterium]
MENRKKSWVLSAIVIVFCVIMAVVDGVLQANYFVKSAIKLVLFLAIPALYAFVDKELEIRPLFVLRKSGIRLALMLCIGVYAVILGGYLLLRNVFDFSAVTGALTGNIGVHRDNFVFVSIYISFVNSLLEEFFFRGFAFLTLRRVAGRRAAYLFSASVFALYHIAMMIGWFDWYVFLIIMAGLFAGGLIFNRLNEKSGTIYPSWFVHMFANFAINTVGFILFGII